VGGAERREEGREEGICGRVRVRVRAMGK